jgi:HEAT repeat protein
MRYVRLAAVIACAGVPFISQAGTMPKTIETLIEELGSPNDRVSLGAVDALIKRAKTDPHCLQRVAKLLDHDVFEYRYCAALVLGRTGAPAESFAPQLAKIFYNPKEFHSLRSKAAWALGLIGDGGVQALSRAMSSGDDFLEGWAADSLGRAKGSRKAVELLITGLGSAHDDVRVIALESLTALGKEARPMLLEALRSKNLIRRALAVEALLEAAIAMI